MSIFDLFKDTIYANKNNISESDEIIKRKVYPEVPPKVEYSLTLLGKSVIPVIDMLREWGEEYRSVFEK